MSGEPGSGPLHDGHSSPTCTATAADLGTPGAGWPRMGAGEGTVQKSQIPANSQTPQTISPQSGKASIGQALGGSQRVQPIYHDTQGRGGAASSSLLFSLATGAG